MRDDVGSVWEVSSGQWPKVPSCMSPLRGQGRGLHLWPEERTLVRGREGQLMSQPAPTQGSRQLIAGELLPWSLALAQPPVLRGAGLPGRELWEVLLPPAPPTPFPTPHRPIPPTSLTPAAAQPPAPSLQLPVSRAPHSRPGSGCLSAGSAAAWDPWAGAGQASQPVQAEALGPRVIEVLWF